MNAAHRVLLVEDNPGDVLLIREALAKADDRLELLVESDGRAALDRLEAMAGDDVPGWILLDLNLPKLDGLELLERLKSIPRLLRIPIVVLTSSAADADIRQAYSRHANSFVTKPADVDDFFDVVSSIVRYWTRTVQLPHRST